MLGGGGEELVGGGFFGGVGGWGGNSPWYPDFEGLLHDDEVCEDAQGGGGCGDHDQHPEIELRFWPVVFPPPYSDFGRHF